MSQPKDSANDLILPKQVIKRASPHFLVSELACKCCGAYKCPTEAVIFFEAVRVDAGFAYVPNSTYRCEAHNKRVGGKPYSPHKLGLAMDIPCVDSVTKKSDAIKRIKIVKAALKNGAQGIGIYASFVHVDIMKRAQGPVMWLG